MNIKVEVNVLISGDMIWGFYVCFLIINVIDFMNGIVDW